MKKVFHIFKVKREEAIGAFCLLVLYTILTACFIYYYYDVFTGIYGDQWKPFADKFQVSGFDHTGYSILTRWEAVYSVYRHPLLMFFSLPLYGINQLLLSITGTNCAQFVIAALQLLLTFYAYIFSYRVFREVIGLKPFDSTLLSWMLFSFAYVMVSMLVPDHFGYSLFLLILALYISGRRMKSGRMLKAWQTAVYFLLTAGVTLSNGVKIFIDALFVNGRKFFRWKYLLTGVIIPAAFIWLFAMWEHRAYEIPRQKEQVEKRQKNEELIIRKIYQRFMDTTKITDEVERRVAFERILEKREKRKERIARARGENAHKGKAISNEGFASWTDISTSRSESIVENLFGESLQLHQSHLLGDTLRRRPVIVKYECFINYVVEGCIVLLFIFGIVCGWRQRFLQMCLMGFAFDLFLHLVLGFGLNEVYIMATHWVFVIPFSIAYLYQYVKGWQVHVLRILLILLTAFLWIWNTWLLTGKWVG